LEEVTQSTEQRILEAAKVVFQSKGFDGARMQEIADEAGVNKALLHYYYRNKETIFKAVFEDAFSQLLAKLNEIFFSNRPLHDKIENFVRYYVSFITRNSYLPLFILNTLHERPGELAALLSRAKISPESLLELIRTQVKDELGIDIDPLHFYINILAMSIFPVIAKPLLQNIFGFGEERMEKFYDDRGTTVPEFILNALKGYEINSGK